MSMIQDPGTYVAKPIGWGVDAKEGKCPQFVCQFEVSQVRHEGEWHPASGQIIGYFNLIKNDGSPNEINLRSFKDVLGWDGNSFDSLENGNWSDLEVQIVVENDTYNGKPSLKVRYLNPRDYAGTKGVQKADPSAVKTLDAKYGATLRALFGSKSPAGTKTAAKTNGGTTTAIAPAPSSIDQAKSAAWVVLKDKTPTYDADRRAETFKNVARAVFPTKEPRDLNADEWKEVTGQLERNFNEATGELIPF